MSTRKSMEHRFYFQLLSKFMQNHGAKEFVRCRSGRSIAVREFQRFGWLFRFLDKNIQIYTNGKDLEIYTNAGKRSMYLYLQENPSCKEGEEIQELAYAVLHRAILDLIEEANIPDSIGNDDIIALKDRVMRLKKMDVPPSIAAFIERVSSVDWLKTRWITGKGPNTLTSVPHPSLFFHPISFRLMDRQKIYVQPETRIIRFSEECVRGQLTYGEDVALISNSPEDLTRFQDSLFGYMDNAIFWLGRMMDENRQYIVEKGDPLDPPINRLSYFTPEMLRTLITHRFSAFSVRIGDYSIVLSKKTYTRKYPAFDHTKEDYPVIHVRFNHKQRSVRRFTICASGNWKNFLLLENNEPFSAHLEVLYGGQRGLDQLLSSLSIRDGEGLERELYHLLSIAFYLHMVTGNLVPMEIRNVFSSSFTKDLSFHLDQIMNQMEMDPLFHKNYPN